MARNDSHPKRVALRVASYNIRHGEGLDGQVDLPRIAGVIRRMDPDLAAVQEVDCYCARSGQVDQAAELGRRLGRYYQFAKFMPFQGGAYGMAVLSRFPLERTTIHPLPAGAEPHCALEVTVPIPAGPVVSFVCVHTDFRREEDRVLQAHALLAALATRKGPVILAGDFNAERTAESMQIIDRAGWQILDKKGLKTRPSDNPVREIDYIIARGLEGAENTPCLVPAEPVASDHRPVSALLWLEPKLPHSQ